MVRKGAAVADIGTDHAYLSAYLVVSGKCPCALATDLRKGPLENAAETLKAFSLDEKIKLRLSDGLDRVSAEDADDFVLAGMGGTLITDILSRAEWIKDSTKRFIFQPMTHSEEVRKFLVESGFEIAEERACFDECRAYIAFYAQYTGKIREHDDAYIFLGELTKCRNDAAAYYYTKQYIYLKQRADALERANLLPEEVEFIRSVLPSILPYTKL